MIIGVTGRRYDSAVTHPDRQDALGGQSVDLFFAAYAHSLAKVGATAVYLPREADPAHLVERLDGFILSGGLDVSPTMYGGSVTPASTAHDLPQDQFDVRLAQLAMLGEKPLLGTCRGLQVLNVARGGTVGDIDEGRHNTRALPASTRNQRVTIRPGSRLAALYGSRVDVNSLHHQAVDVLGEGVRVTAEADDGVIEGIEVRGCAAIGVQWHPEFYSDVDPVLRWLVDAAKESCARKETVGERI
ncbi:gamma-glutamyl-gamma-aminobutyrate hydrolase family protein [Mycolicibacterium sp.]|uniref:gamma-glutamyl-gamma-aminobutyrate hydrolase family protein n=1 Tax=Mycolicibacterium sp. TaxID=2320850 RepID=UPI003D0C29A1